MLDQLVAAIWAFIYSPYFPTFVAFLIGWLAMQRPAWATKLWAAVLGVRTQLNDIGKVIDAIDAILKANGVLPADAPKLSVAEVKAIMDGRVNVDTVAKAQRARLAALRAPQV